MKYNFDEIIDRRNTNAMNLEGFREYIFHADQSLKFPFPDDQFIRMWIADMEFATPQVIIDAVKDRLDKRIFGYTKVFDPEYYEAFAGWTQKMYGWSCKKEHLFTAAGVVPALYELAEYVCKPGEKILTLTPAYSYFKHAADYHGIELVCSNLINRDNYYTIDFEDLEAKAADPAVKLLFFCNPHNPSGRIWTEEELRRVAEICFDHGVLIVSDEIHCDLIRTGLKHTPLAKLYPDSDQIITCMAPSKTFNMAGFMLANIVIPDLKVMKVWKERHYDWQNPLSVEAVKAAYQYGEDWLTQLKLYLDENFRFVGQYLAQNLPLAKYRISEATYLGWVDVSAYVSPEDDLPMLFAREAGVLLEGGDMFVTNSDGFIRLNLACPKSVLEEGLRRICKLLAERAAA